MRQICNILIVDDNPFPTRETCKVLIENFSKYCSVSNNNILLESFEKIYKSKYKDLVKNFPGIRGKDLFLQFAKNLTLTIYNYDPTSPQSDNQSAILQILKKRYINILWCDRGHTPFEIIDFQMYELDGEYNTNSDELFKNEDIISQLIKNNLKQVAVYTFNQYLTERETEERKLIIYKIFKSKLNINDIYIIETSPVLNIFNKDDLLSSGKEDNKFLGTIRAYELYGKLLGNVLFDLFFQIKENKIKLSCNQNRYNFFNANNREILRYFKLLNSNDIAINLKEYPFFKLGLISFYGNIFENEYYLIDAPYKEYYEKYDILLQKGPENINSIFDFSLDDDSTSQERWMYYKYKYIGDKFVYCHKKHSALNGKGELTEKYLPFLHSAIFYQPDFYEVDSTYNNFYKCNSEKYCSDKDMDSIEIYYFFKKIYLKGIEGVIHFALWRRGAEFVINLESTIDAIWNNYYNVIEPKIEETLINIIINENHKQSIKAAIAQVMARNSSHNIGSHVMNKLVGDLNNIEIEKFNIYKSDITLDIIHKEKLEGLHGEERKKTLLLDQLAIFNNYIKCRMDYVSDITYGVPMMQTSKSAKEIFEDLDKVRLLLENISGLSEFRYEIKFAPIDQLKDLILAMPNDVLGCQALYNIIENIIRNTAKHNDDTALPENGVVFTVVFKEAKYSKNKVSYEQINELNSLYEVTIYDNFIKDGSAQIGADEREEYSQDVKSDDSMDISAIDYLVWKLNSKINKSLLNKKNTLRASNLGFIEMEASACYLRKLDMASLEDNNYHIELENDFVNKLYNESLKINILKAVKVEGKYLGFRFYVLKPTEVLFVSDDHNIKITEEQLKGGIKLLGIKEFEEQLSKDIVFNHQFLIYDDECVGTILLKFKTALPLRCFMYNNILDLISQKDKESVLCEVWIKWGAIIKKRNKNYIFKIHNDFPENEENNQYDLVIFNHMGSKQSREVVKGGVKTYMTPSNYQPTALFFECLSSKAQEKLPHPLGLRVDFDKYVPNLIAFESKYQDLYTQFHEAICLKTLIIDERIQNLLDESYIDVTYRSLYKYSNIMVPEKSEINLSGNIISRKDFYKYLAVNKNLLAHHDFVLLHYSILERVFNNNKNMIDLCLRSMARRCNVVVTSGRGTPTGLPIEVRFIHLSSFLHAFSEVRSKHYISYVLHSTRKSNKI